MSVGYHMTNFMAQNFLIHRCNYILLSQAYCLWQVVKTPTIIFNNSVCPWVTIWLTLWHRISWSIGATTYSYLKRIVYDKLLKPRQSFRIILYIEIIITTIIYYYSRNLDIGQPNMALEWAEPRINIRELTLWSRFLLEKMIVSHLFKKIP